jgi:hypothetical protein
MSFAEQIYLPLSSKNQRHKNSSLRQKLYTKNLRATFSTQRFYSKATYFKDAKDESAS